MDQCIRHNRHKYDLEVHLIFATKYRKQILKGALADDIKQKIYDICNRDGYSIVAMETDKDHIHILLRYGVTDRVCDIVKVLKQETTYYIWQRYSKFLRQCYWKKKIFWSDGYFACSVGKVSRATIKHYIDTQG